jgi:hypothetical protein
VQGAFIGHPLTNDEIALITREPVPDPKPGAGQQRRRTPPGTRG